jgi:hypothetical protein
MAAKAGAPACSKGADSLLAQATGRSDLAGVLMIRMV